MQELRMLSSVTLKCQATKIVTASGSQLSELQSVSQLSQVFKIAPLFSSAIKHFEARQFCEANLYLRKRQHTNYTRPLGFGVWGHGARNSFVFLNIQRDQIYCDTMG